MKLKIRNLFKKSLLSITMIFIISGCATNIKEIVDNPDKYSKKEVTISGNVSEATNLAIFKFYKLKDKTGEIYIITDSNPPKNGVSKKVNGKVMKAFEIMGKSWTVIKESKSE